MEGDEGSAHAEVGGFDISAVVVLLEVLESGGRAARMGFWEAERCKQRLYS
jgi:hypothetical protein